MCWWPSRRDNGKYKYIPIREDDNPNSTDIIISEDEQQPIETLPIETLPDEILINLFDYLDIEDLEKCLNTCTRWSSAVKNTNKWKSWQKYSNGMKELVRQLESNHSYLNFLKTKTGVLSIGPRSGSCKYIVGFSLLMANLILTGGVGSAFMIWCSVNSETSFDKRTFGLLAAFLFLAAVAPFIFSATTNTVCVYREKKRRKATIKDLIKTRQNMRTKYPEFFNFFSKKSDPKTKDDKDIIIDLSSKI